MFSLFFFFFFFTICMSIGLWYTIFLMACMASIILFMWLHLFFFLFSYFQVSVASSVPESRDDLNFSGAGTTQLVGKQLIPRQMISLLLKRLHHVRRSKKGFISEVSQGSRSLWLQPFHPPLLIHCRCWFVNFVSLPLFVSISQPKRWGSHSVGWEGCVCSHFPTLAHIVLQTGVVLPATSAAAIWLWGFQ